jgi:hypothetical protein
LRKRVVKNIKKLEMEPIPKDKKHIIEVKGNRYLCEMTIDKIRLYYEVAYNKVFIFNGEVLVFSIEKNHKSGNSKNYPRQRNFIKRVKNFFQKQSFIKSKRL